MQLVLLVLSIAPMFSLRLVQLLLQLSLLPCTPQVRALWRLDPHTGKLLSVTTFPNRGKLKGLRDGMMCISPTTDGTNGVVATGYTGGESNYNPATGQYADVAVFLHPVPVGATRSRPPGPQRGHAATHRAADVERVCD